MQTIITKASNELGVKPVPSKRVCIVFCGLYVLLHCFKEGVQIQ